MFEKYVSSIILAVARKYIKNVNLSDLKLSLWGGAVTLNDVELRVEVLQEELEGTGRPISLKRAYIQELKLNIPWASLRYQPAKVRVRNAEVVLVAGDGGAVAPAASAPSTPTAVGTEADAADDEAAGQELDSTQMGWAQSLLSQAMANLVLDINGLTVRLEMLHSASPAESAPPGSAPPSPRHSLAGSPALPTPSMPSPPPTTSAQPVQSLRRRASSLAVHNGEAVPVTGATFGLTASAGHAQELHGRLVLCDPPRIDAGVVLNAEALRQAIAVAERGTVSFVEKARRVQAAGALALVVINSDEADFVPLGMGEDPGDDILIPVVSIRRSTAALLLPPAHLGATDPFSATLHLEALDVVGTALPAAAADAAQGPNTTTAAAVGGPGTAVAASPAPAATAAAMAGGTPSTPPRGTRTRSTVAEVEPGSTLVLVFDVIRSHSTDAEWRDAHIDPAGEQAAAAVFASESGGSAGSDSGAGNGRPLPTIHRVIDFANLALYVCGMGAEFAIVDGLDFTVRLRTRSRSSTVDASAPTAADGLRQVEVLAPAVRLTLNHHQLRLLLHWHEWWGRKMAALEVQRVMRLDDSVAASATETPLPLVSVSASSVVATPESAGDGLPTVLAVEHAGVDPSVAKGAGSHDSRQNSSQQGNQEVGWLGWVWGIVVGEEGEAGSGTDSDEDADRVPPGMTPLQLRPSHNLPADAVSDGAASAVVAGTRYRALSKPQIRTGWELDSKKLGKLTAGEVITASAHYHIPDGAGQGQLRVQIAGGRGWVSVRSRSGTLLLEQLASNKPDGRPDSTGSAAAGAGTPLQRLAEEGETAASREQQVLRSLPFQGDIPGAAREGAGAQSLLTVYLDEVEIALRHQRSSGCDSSGVGTVESSLGGTFCLVRLYELLVEQQITTAAAAIMAAGGKGHSSNGSAELQLRCGYVEALHTKASAVDSTTTTTTASSSSSSSIGGSLSGPQRQLVPVLECGVEHPHRFVYGSGLPSSAVVETPPEAEQEHSLPAMTPTQEELPDADGKSDSQAGSNGIDNGGATDAVASGTARAGDSGMDRGPQSPTEPPAATTTAAYGTLPSTASTSGLPMLPGGGGSAHARSDELGAGGGAPGEQQAESELERVRRRPATRNAVDIVVREEPLGASGTWEAPVIQSHVAQVRWHHSVEFMALAKEFQDGVYSVSSPQPSPQPSPQQGVSPASLIARELATPMPLGYQLGGFCPGGDAANTMGGRVVASATDIGAAGDTETKLLLKRVMEERDALREEIARLRADREQSRAVVE